MAEPADASESPGVGILTMEDLSRRPGDPCRSLASMRYTNQFRNTGYMYTVYGSGEPDDYILVATVPAVGMFDVAMRLKPMEVALLRKNEDEFTALVTRFVRGRESPEYKIRRMERQISSVSSDEIEVNES